MNMFVGSSTLASSDVSMINAIFFVMSDVKWEKFFIFLSS